MKLEQKKHKVLQLHNLLQQANVLLRELNEINPLAFGEVYRVNSEFEEVLEAVLSDHNLIDDKTKH
jgi:hypothetical protein